QQRPVARPAGVELFRVDDAADLINHSRDVELLVGVDAAVDALCLFDHAGPVLLARWVGRHHRPGRSDRTLRVAGSRLLSGHVRPDRLVRVPGRKPGRQINGKTRSQSLGGSDPAPTRDRYIMSVTG